MKIAYNLKMKKDVIDYVHQGMTILEVSQMYNVSRQTIGNWLKYSDKYLNENRTGLKPFDIEEKVEVLRLIENVSLTQRQIADLNR